MGVCRGQYIIFLTFGALVRPGAICKLRPGDHNSLRATSLSDSWGGDVTLPPSAIASAARSALTDPCPGVRPATCRSPSGQTTVTCTVSGVVTSCLGRRMLPISHRRWTSVVGDGGGGGDDAGSGRRRRRHDYRCRSPELGSKVAS